MNGKATCAILKQIRRDIAEKNDIALTIAECTHQGDCAGTCPRCEAEVKILEKALAEKKKKGLKTAVAGISAGLLAVGLSSCTPADKVGAQSLIDKINDKLHPHVVEELDGDLMPPDWEPEPDPGEDGGETCIAEATAGELAAPEPEPELEPEPEQDGEEFELEGDVLAEDFEGLIAPEEPEPVTDWDEEEYPPLAGIMPAPDWEPDTPEDAAP